MTFCSLGSHDNGWKTETRREYTMQQVRYFIENLNEDNKRKFCKYERCCLKQINTTKAICFNQNCIRNFVRKVISIRGRATFHYEPSPTTPHTDAAIYFITISLSFNVLSAHTFERSKL